MLGRRQRRVQRLTSRGAGPATSQQGNSLLAASTAVAAPSPLSPAHPTAISYRSHCLSILHPRPVSLARFQCQFHFSFNVSSVYRFVPWPWLPVPTLSFISTLVFVPTKTYHHILLNYDTPHCDRQHLRYYCSGTQSSHRKTFRESYLGFQDILYPFCLVQLAIESTSWLHVEPPLWHRIPNKRLIYEIGSCRRISTWRGWFFPSSLHV